MLNYRQLHQFWQVARAGGIARAAERLDLAPQTLSGQIASLEADLGVALFRRVGRRLELTDTGREVLEYADDIFQLGNELEQWLRNRGGGRQRVFRVGVANVVPKIIAHRLLSPALALPEPVRIVCREDSLESLLAQLALHRLDLVLADRPMPGEVSVRAYSHKLGQCGLGFFASTGYAATLEGPFPSNLNKAAMLVPAEDSVMWHSLAAWLKGRRLRPRIVGEFDDPALMQSFGQAGLGVFVAPAVIRESVCRQFDAVCLGETEDIVESFYAISVERRLTHPATVAIHQAARENLFVPA